MAAFEGLDEAAASYVSGQAASTAAQIRQSLGDATGTNPDQEADLQRAAAATVTPMSAARAMPRVVTAQAAQQGIDANALTQHFPNLAQFLTDPNKARIVHDDIPATARVEQAAGAVASAQPATPEQSIWSRLGSGSFWIDTAKWLTSADDTGGLARSVYQGAQRFSTSLGENAAMVAGGVGGLVDSVAGTNLQDLAFGVANHYRLTGEAIPAATGLANKAAEQVGSLGAQLPLILGTGGSLEAPEAATTAFRTVVNAMRHATASMAVPAVNDAIGIGRSVYDQTGDGAAATKAALTQYLTSTAAGVVPMAVPGGLATRLASGAAIGADQSEVARQVMNLTLPESLQHKFSWEDVVLGGIAGSMLGGFGPRAPDAMHREVAGAATASQAETTAAGLKSMLDAASVSKLRERDPQAFHDLVERSSENGPVTDLWIDARKFDETLSQAGVTRPDLEATMPDVARQIEGALSTGGDVRISLADFATHIAGTGLEDKLLQDVRPDPDAMSLAESREFVSGTEGRMRQQGAQMGVEQGQVDQFGADRAQVHQGIKDQLDAMGRFPDQTNDVYATLHSEFLSSQAARLGILPSEMQQRYPVRIGMEKLTGDVLDQGQRGFFDPATKTIGLLKGADLSSLIHESGHYFLDSLADMAGRQDAPAEIRGDMSTLLDWFGVKGTTDGSAIDEWHRMTLEQQRHSHEQFARGFEAYAMEGQAPSVELRPIFQRFRTWLLTIYRKLSSLNVELTPEVRGVMDRMLATNEAIRTAEIARNYEPLFKTPEEAQLFAVDWQGYQRTAQDATADAVSTLQAKGLKDMAWLSRTRAAAHKSVEARAVEARKEVERETRAEVMQRPEYQAWQYLTSKITEDGTEAGRLKTDDLRHMYGSTPDAPWRKLSTLHMTSDANGLHPDLVADMFGFPSGRELVETLGNIDHPKTVIDGLTDQRMLERHGDLATPEALQRAADEAVHNEARARFIATEMTALEKATNVRETVGVNRRGGPVTIDALVKAAKQVAEDTIARMKVRDLVPSRFTAAESRAARETVKALAKGDIPAAAEAKRAQMLNNRLAKTSLDVADEINAGLKYLGRFSKAATRDAVGPEYVAQIDALLERYDLRKGTPLAAADRRQSLLQWVEAQRKEGLEPAIPDSVLDEANRTPYREMPVEDFRGLLDSVKSIEHLGRLKNKLLDRQEQRDLDAVVSEAIDSMAKLPQREAATPRNPGSGGKSLDRVNAKFLNGASLLRSMDSSLLKMEQVFDWLDGKNPDGVFNRTVFRRIADGQGIEHDLLTEVNGKLRALADRLPKEAQRDLLERYTLPELKDSQTGKPSSMLKKEILAIALNTGNESNMGKMLAGEGWHERDVWKALDRHMTKSDWDFVQGVWDSLETLWPHVEALEKRLTGVAPDRVVSRPVVTPHGTYEGGYYPVVYDPLRSRDADIRSDKNAADLFENTFTRPQTASGHTKARVDYARPLFLSMDVLPRHISQVVHDVAYREAVIDANKLLSDSRIQTAIENSLGREYFKQLRPWLQAIANDKVYDERGLGFWDKAAHGARTTATIVGLGYRLSTMLIHGSTAASNSIGELGPKWFASGVKGFLGSPSKMVEARDFVFERSSEMRNRMNDVDRDVRDSLRELDLKSQGGAGAIYRGAESARRFAYYGISMLDMGSALPTWLGAYNKGLAGGKSELDAIYEADKSVRNAHGSGGAKDLSAIQRGSEFQKLFTMFYSFWNHFYNRQRDIGRTAVGIPDLVRAGDFQGARRDFAMVLARSWFYFVIPQLLHAALKAPASGQDDQKHWAVWAAEEIGAGLFSGIPIVRDLANQWSRQGLTAKATQQAALETPAASVIVKPVLSLIDLKHAITGQPVSDRWVKHAIETAGYTFGLPTGQVATSAQFLWDVQHGKQTPHDLADWWRGVAHGDTRAH